MDNEVKLQEQTTEKTNEVKEDKVWKIPGFEIKRSKKVEEPKEVPEAENTENQEAKPKSKWKKFIKNAGTAFVILGAVAGGMAIGKALDGDHDDEAYELTTGEFEPVDEAQVAPEVAAESENPKED